MRMAIEQEGNTYTSIPYYRDIFYLYFYLFILINFFIIINTLKFKSKLSSSLVSRGT